MIRFAAAAVCTSLGLLAGCASPLFDVGRSEAVLPLNRAWVDGRRVDYVTTDTSDAAMARMIGVNYVPRLRDAIPATRLSLLERVYKFSGDEQLSIFQSAPLPAGAANADRAYSPLWRVVMVHRHKPGRSAELRSEEELLALADKGDVSLEVTDIVVNCPVIRGADGRSLAGVR